MHEILHKEGDIIVNDRNKYTDNKGIVLDKYTISDKEIPSELKSRLTLLNVFFAFLVFVFIVSIFVHYPIYTYFVEIIILIIVYKTMKRVNVLNFLTKQVKIRPEEKISNVLMSIKSSSVPYNSKLFIAIAFCY